MPRFSVIIPVYNVEPYIKDCLDSVMNQTYKDFEVIVVNDGTPDNSMDIVKNYPVKIINQENQGLSMARNAGAKKAKGDYILFLDSDDTWNKDLLKKIDTATKNDPDLVRFQIQETYPNGNINPYPEKTFKNLSGVEAFATICTYHYIENAWCYAIKRTFYQKEKFRFTKNTVHEDFGLFPLVIIKAKTVNCIDYIGYNYLQRQGSIMNTKNPEKDLRKVKDMFTHYEYLMAGVEHTDLDTTLYKSYVSNSVIKKVCSLTGKNYRIYKKKLKEERVYDNLVTDTFARKIKKIVIQLSPKLYYKISGK